MNKLGKPCRKAALPPLVLAALLASGCSARSGDAAAPPPPPEVDVASVVARPVQVWDAFNGRVSAPQTVEVRPRVSGYIDRIAFTEGSEVKAGELLLVIDPRPYRAVLQRAQAQLERARAAAALAQSRQRRTATLIAADAISREDADATVADERQTGAELQAAQAAVASAKLDLDFTEVRAPVAGRVSRANLTRGNLAQADQTVLTTLVSQDPMYVYFDCDEHSFLAYQAVARRAGGRKDAYPVRIGLADEQGFPHAGTVDFLDNRLDPATGTVRVRAVLANRERLLTPGMFARVQLQGSGAVAGRLIDERAILTDQNRKYVYVLGAGNKAQRKDIVPGRQVDGLRLVQSGLADSDQVIVTGTQKIFFDGMVVKPSRVATAGAAPARAAAAGQP